MQKKQHWKARLDEILQDRNSLCSEIDYITNYHNDYYEQEYHFYLVAHLAYILTKLSNQEIDNQIKKLIFKLYPDLDGQNYDIVIRRMIEAYSEVGVKITTLEAGNNSETNPTEKLIKFNLRDYLDSSSGKITAKTSSISLGSHNPLDRVSAINIEGDNLTTYLTSVLSEIDALDQDKIILARRSIIFRLNSYFRNHDSQAVRDSYANVTEKYKEKLIESGIEVEEEDLVGINIPFSEMATLLNKEQQKLLMRIKLNF